MPDDQKRQPARPDYAEAEEPRCPICGEALLADFDEEGEIAEYRCPNGHGEDPLGEAEVGSRPRERVGELGEDS